MLAQILAGTPAWVFAVFVALVYLGYIQSRTRRVSARRLAAVPVVLGAFSIYGVHSAFGSQPAAIVAWALGVGLAFLLNVRFRQPRGVQYIPAEQLYLISGSWIPMALMMTMFWTRYAVTVALTRNAGLAAEVGFVAGVCLLYGLLGGTFFARAARAYNSRLRTATA